LGDHFISDKYIYIEGFDEKIEVFICQMLTYIGMAYNFIS